jgi:hypothetical protein
MKTVPVKTVYLEMLDRPRHVAVPPPIEGLDVVWTKKPSLASYRTP